MGVGGVSVGGISGFVELDDRLSPALALAGKRMAEYERKFASIGKGLSLAISAPLAVAGGASVAFARKFEKEMTTIETLVGVNRKTVSEWKREVLGLAGEVGRAPEELAHALFVVTSAGERGSQALDVLTESAKASAIGLGDTAVIARSVTAAMQAYRSTNLSAAEATRVMVATVQEGNLEAADLAGSLGRVMGIAAQTGTTFREVGAFIATFTRMGVSAEESVTALRGVLSTIIKPSNQARDALASMGLSIDDVRAGIRERGLTQTLIDLYQRVGDNVDVLGEIIPNIRALSGFLGTAGAQGAQFAGIIDTINRAADDANFVTNRYNRTTETLGHRWESLTARLKTIGITVVTPLLSIMGRAVEALHPLTEGLFKLANAFAMLPKGVQNVGYALAGILIVAPPVMMALSGIVGMLQSATSMAILNGMASLVGHFRDLVRLVQVMGATSAARLIFANWAATLNEAALAVKGFGVALWALATNPLTIAVGAIVGITSALRALTGSWETTLGIIAPPIGGLVSAWNDLRSAVGRAMDGPLGKVVQVFRDIATVVHDRLLRVWSSLLDAWDRAAAALNPLRTIMGGLADVARVLGDMLGVNVKLAFQDFLGWVARTVPLVRDLATAIAFITGTSKEWVSSLHEQAEAIRAANAAASSKGGGSDIKLYTQDWEGLARQLQTTSISWMSLEVAAKQAHQTHKTGGDSLVAQLARMKAATDQLTEAQRAEIKAGIALGLSAEDIGKKLHLSTGIVDLFTQGLKDTEKGAGGAANAIRDLADKMFGRTAIADAERYLAALGGVQNLYLLTGDMLEELRSVIDEAAAAYRRMGQEAKAAALEQVKVASLIPSQAVAGAGAAGVMLPPGVQGERNLWWQSSGGSFYDGIGTLPGGVKSGMPAPGKDWGEQFSDFREGLSDLSRAFAEMTQIMGDSMSEFVRSIGQMVSSMNLAAQAGEQTAKGLTKGGVGGLLQAAAGLMTGVGATWGAAQGHSRGGNVASGALTGASYGAAFGPIGAGVGAAIGGLMGLFGKTKSKMLDEQATAEIKKMQAALLSTYGSLEEIDRLGRQVGVDLAGAWGDQSRAGLEHFTKLAEEFKQKLDISNEIAALKGELADLESQQIPTWDAVSAAAERYGMSIAGLGNKIQQLYITDAATQIINDFETLTAAGASAATVARGMQKELNKLVQDSIKYGAALPANMKPVIEALIKQGLLFDANGKKITDISQLKWGDPVESEADKINKAITDLIAKIQKLVDKLNGIDGMEVTVGVNYEAEEFPEPSDMPTPTPLPPEYGPGPGYGGGYYYHRGGLIQAFHEGGRTALAGASYWAGGTALARAHTGMLIGGLASDEVPIIARRGEGVLSDDVGMPTLGAWALDMLNRGAVATAGGGGFGAGMDEAALATAIARALKEQGINGASFTAVFTQAQKESYYRDEAIPGIIDVLKKGGQLQTDFRVAIRAEEE